MKKYINECFTLFIYFYFFREEAELLARALGCRLIRTSVKEDVNVAAVFRHLAVRCLADMREPREDYYSLPNGHHPIAISKLQKTF